MHHRFAPYFRAFLFSLCLLFTAQVAEAQQQQIKTIKPKMAIEDVDFVAGLLNTIDISGQEVDAFLEVRGIFLRILEGAVKEKKMTSDIVTVEMSVPQAQNLITLMNRAKLNAAGAEKFKTILSTIIDSAKAELGETTSKK
ncbi:MAG TPA: hypothetical protein VEC36_13400 [Patescibacteria group bacterium]|nr:hypothetical protein [Patescibacteria group bacterium]